MLGRALSSCFAPALVPRGPAALRRCCARPAPSGRLDEALDRSNTTSLKVDKYAGRDVIPAWVADMDLVAPACVREACAAQAASGVYGYVRPGALAHDLTVARLARVYGATGAAAGDLVWLPGIVPALNHAARVRPRALAGPLGVVCALRAAPVLGVAPELATAGTETSAGHSQRREKRARPLQTCLLHP